MNTESLLMFVSHSVCCVRVIGECDSMRYFLSLDETDTQEVSLARKILEVHKNI